MVFVRAGLIGCFLLCIILGACEAFTMYVLSKFAERYQAPTYSGLIRKALGRKLSASGRLASCFQDALRIHTVVQQKPAPGIDLAY